MAFHETKLEVKNTINDLRNLARNSIRQSFRDENGLFFTEIAVLEDIIDTESFTVGVVGVFNTGKSMFLNSLLHKNVLDCRIIPETAAITSLKYGKEDSATIHFWDAQQWNQIEAQGKLDEREKKFEISKMTGEVRQSLGKEFDKYITKNGRTDENVPVKDLSKYTSANAENGLARLVREVEIKTSLKLCQDNIRIVDTPGLNDPIRLREYVTEEIFLPRCQMLVWLLPAKMAFTDYDKRFLKKQLKKGRVNRLFVVVNQTDTLDTEEDVNIVVSWAREQIKQTIQEYYQDSSETKKFDEPEIFPLSAKQSYLNRTCQQSKASWTDKESGVPAFEARLREFLFEGERSIEMQTNWTRRLESLVNEELIQIDIQISNLDKPIEEIESIIKETKEEADIIKHELDRVLDEADKTIRHFETTYDALVTILSKDIPLLANPIEEAAVDKLDQFLDRNFISVIMDIKSWSAEEFEPFLTETIRNMVEDTINRAMDDIDELVRESLEEVRKAYQRMVENIRVKIPETTDPTDYAKIAGEAALGAGIGLALREMLLVALGSMSAYLYGLIAGPIGWVIVVVAAVWQAIRGGQRMKERCRAELRAKLPEALRKTLEGIVREAEPRFKELKEELVSLLKEAAEEPAKKIEERLSDRLSNLEELLEDKISKEYDRDQKLSALNTEKTSLGNLQLRIEGMKQGENGETSVG